MRGYGAILLHSILFRSKFAFGVRFLLHRYVDGECHTFQAVGAPGYLTVMQVDKLLHEIQANAETGGLALCERRHKPAETRKQPFRLRPVYAYAIVDHSQLHIQSALRHSDIFGMAGEFGAHRNVPVVGCVFYGIEQQIVDHLLHRIGIIPEILLPDMADQLDGDAPLCGVDIEQPDNALKLRSNIIGRYSKGRCLPFHFAEIQNLSGEMEHPLHVVVHKLQVLPDILGRHSGEVAQQIAHRSQDKRERRAQLMRDIVEEVDFAGGDIAFGNHLFLRHIHPLLLQFQAYV